MKPPPQRWFLPLGALVAVALGFGIGRWTSHSPEMPEPEGEPPSGVTSTTAFPSGRFADAVRLDRIPPPNRTASFDAFVAELSVSDLAVAREALRAQVADLDESALRSYLNSKRRSAPTFREELAVEEVAARLGTLDPEGALEMARVGWPPIIATSLVRGAFTAIARTNPDEAIRRASDLANAGQRAGAVSAVANTLALSNPARGLDFIASVPLENHAMAGVREEFFDRWLNNDPDGALRHATSLADGAVKDGVKWDRVGSDLKWIVTAMAHRDPEATFAWIGSLKDPPNGLLSETLHILSDKDAGAAMKKVESFMMAFEAGDMRYAGFRPESWGSQHVFGQWITQDADAATAWALALPDSKARDDACGQMFEQLCRSDAQRAVAFLESMPEEIAKSAASGGGLMYHLTRALPEEAVRLTLKFSGEKRTLAMMTSEFYRWGETDSEGAVDFLLKQPDCASEQLGEVWETLLYEVARDDPGRALALLDSGQLPPGIVNEARANALSVMAETDPGAAVEIAQSESNPEVRAKSIPRLLAMLARSDPAAAAKIALGEADPTLRDELIAESVHAWVNDDPIRLREWAESVEAGRRGEVMAAVALSSLASTKVPFDEALKLAASIPDRDSEAISHAVQARAEAQARADPRATVEWARHLAEEAWRGPATKEAVSEWVRFDSHGATEWAASLGAADATVAESAAEALGDHFLGDRSAGQAAHWLARIQDPGKRTALVRAHFRPGAGSSFLDKVIAGLAAEGLPEAELNAYRKLGNLPPR